MPYRKDIDGLRAIAVLLVVLFHAKVPGFSGGFVGVDVFFVISGFLITGLIANDVTAGRFSFAQFYHRRIRRIVPALVVVYLASTLAALLLMLPRDAAEFGRSLRDSALFASNFHFYSQAGYFDGPSDLKPLLHTWSLSIEEQFYVVWPALLLLIARRWLCWLPHIVAVAGLTSLAAFMGMVVLRPEAAFFLTPFRAWELMLGAFLALMRHQPELSMPRRQGLAAIGLLLIVVPAVTADGDTDLGMLATVWACAGAALLLLAGPDTTTNRLLSLKPAVAVGLISYSLYLWHWPFLAFARYYFDRPLAWLEVGALIFASFVAATLTYFLVERPARTIKLARMRPLIGGGLLALATVALAGDSVGKNGGWTFNIDPRLRQLDAAVRSVNIYRKRCFGVDKAFGNDDACTFGHARENGSYDMAIFGDSHADHFVPAIALLAKKAGLSGRQITVGGCLVLLGYDNRSPYRRKSRCPASPKAMVRFVEQNPGLKLAVLAHRWSIYNGRPYVDGDEAKTIFLLTSANDALTPQRSAAILHQSLEQTLDFFAERGITVLLLGEVPSMGKDQTRCLARAIKNGSRLEDCGRSIDAVQGEIGQTNAFLSALASKRRGVFFFSPASVLCRAGWCPAVRNGVVMYRDSSHLNRAGAESLVDVVQLPAVDR
jgi:peptidoglycan/LPS O-acetylase OafA/YrhL